MSNLNSAYDRNNSSKKRSRRPDPWAGESMFSTPKNRKFTPRSLFPETRVNKNKTHNVKTTRKRINMKERLENVVKTINNSSKLVDTQATMNVRERAAQNLIDRVAKHTMDYMHSNGPSSGASKILVKRIAMSLPIEAKAAVVALTLATGYAGYRTVQLARKYPRYVLPTVISVLSLISRKNKNRL